MVFHCSRCHCGWGVVHTSSISTDLSDWFTLDDLSDKGIEVLEAIQTARLSAHCHMHSLINPWVGQLMMAEECRARV